MTRTKQSTILTLFSTALLALGCQESEACQRARMQTAKSWAAAQRIAKTQIAPGGSVSTWETVEKQAELLQSAFATPQITWSSAEKKLDELNQIFTQYERGTPKDSTVTSFRALLERAKQEQTATAKACK